MNKARTLFWGAPRSLKLKLPMSCQALKAWGLGFILGGPFDLESTVSKVGYGDYNRVSKGC